MPAAAPVDAVLLISFGGPEGHDEVLPFLRQVTAGRGIPDERLEQVGAHYHAFDGVSPINGQNRDLIRALRPALAENGPGLPVYWGNRNWHPFLADTLRQMADDGIRHAVGVITSAYSSWSGCRQYREDLAARQAEVGPAAPQVSLIRKFYNHPGFVRANSDAVAAALAEVPTGSRLVFTAHSVPEAMAAKAGPHGGAYIGQLTETARLVCELLGRAPDFDLVWQSRSGPPTQPWLEPDVNDHLRALATAGVPGVVLAPIGFISDHMEVLYDLDTEARATADEIGLPMARAATAGTAPGFVEALRGLVAEVVDPSLPRPTLGERGPSHLVCPQGCCLQR